MLPFDWFGSCYAITDGKTKLSYVQYVFTEYRQLQFDPDEASRNIHWILCCALKIQDPVPPPNLPVVLLTGLIIISKPVDSLLSLLVPGLSLPEVFSVLSIYTCPPSSCSFHNEPNCFPCGPLPPVPASSLLGGLLMAKLNRLLGSLTSAYQSRCVTK